MHMLSCCWHLWISLSIIIIDVAVAFDDPDNLKANNNKLKKYFSLGKILQLVNVPNRSFEFIMQRK